MAFLVGDIGGTKTELALYDSAALGTSPVYVKRYPSAAFKGLHDVVERFLKESPEGTQAARGADGKRVVAAAFGIAGPVVEQRCRATNLPWIVVGAELAQQLECPVRLLNDFEAVALGVGRLGPDQCHVLWERAPQEDGPVAVLGAGTGLGEAVVVPMSDGPPRVLASEGGHTDFAPRNDTEIALLRFLQERHGRVSVERVVSGPGLESLLDFVITTRLAAATPDTLVALEHGDRAAVIGERGLAGGDPACQRALQLFVETYGAEAGNLALKVLPSGGVYVAGGIAPKLLPALTDGRFLEAMFAKGRMRPVLEQFPVAVVLEPRVALIGALRKAAAAAS